MTIKIKNLIYTVRGKQVILDSDLAKLYEVETGALNRAVSRNVERFSENFQFRLTRNEFIDLRFQNGIINAILDAVGKRRHMLAARTPLLIRCI